MDPITFVSDPSSDFHMGKGIPQNLDLERFQSFALFSQLPNLPSPVDFGFQLILLFKAINSSLFSVTLINHEFKG